jgi:hypothetical protein
MTGKLIVASSWKIYEMEAADTQFFLLKESCHPLDLGIIIGILSENNKRIKQLLVITLAVVFLRVFIGRD